MSQTLEELLKLRRAPVAVTFRETPPEHLARVRDPGPSGCTYWLRASRGESFYTESTDHAHCPIGAHTHGAELDAAGKKELEELIGTMVELAYLDESEVPSIPHRDSPMRVVVYTPLSEATETPDVVLVCAEARQIMLLAEAAHAAGLDAAPLMGRPTCAAIPEAMQSHRSVTNLACIGNRVYTQLGDGELYFVFPGDQLGAITDRLATTIHANAELENFHRARL